MRLELAADYLVMAAWLAYLKSRLLLPEGAKGDEPSAADLATALALRLRRLEAIREAAKRMEERAQLGRDVFARGAPEPIAIRKEVAWEATLYDLLSAYARQRQKQMTSRVVMPKRHVWSLVDAREALERLIGQAQDWTVLDSYLVRYIAAARAAADRRRLGVLGEPGARPRRPARAAPGRRLRAALGARPDARARAGGTLMSRWTRQ